MTEKTIGRAVPRKEGWDKLKGAARYVDDIAFDDMLHGTTVRSSAPRGKIRNIKFAPHIPWNEFTIVTAKDIPGNNAVALIMHDQPFLAADEFNHCDEAVVLLAHPDKYRLEEARKAVTIEFDVLPSVLSVDDALSQKHLIWGADNLLKSILIEKGNIANGFQNAPHIVEDVYETGAQEQLYIETNGMIAVANATEGVTVWGSLQCPYYIHKALKHLFSLPSEKIRVVQMETGGGFGGKEEYPSILAGHAALLAWKSGKPVKMIYDREEDMAATTKRHPSRTKIRSAFDNNGKMLALEIEFIIDGGAYLTLTPVVLSRGSIHASGPYECDNVVIRGKAVATNTPPHGAFRGFGAPQSLFAIEKHMDKAARALKMSPAELRAINFLSQGKVSATGQIMREPILLPELLKKALQESRYFELKKQFDSENANPKNTIKRGIGFSTFMHGSGFTGSGEKYLASVAGVEGTEEGFIRVLAASTEIGQGTNTMFSQVVSDALELPYEFIEVARPDTKYVPDSGPTVASRTCMVVGKLVETAALSLKQTLIQSGYLKEGYTPTEFKTSCARYVKEFGSLKSYSQYKQPSHINWDDQKYSGDAYTTFAWAVYVAQVAVDTTTFETRVEDFVGFQEVGKVIHPVLAAGQIEGGIAQGIGYALYENIVWKNGAVANNTMTNYIMPTSMDLPRIRVFFEEMPYFMGPAGAKGIGELPLDGPAPAILNAVEDALPGINVTTIPLTPERLMATYEAMQK